MVHNNIDKVIVQRKLKKAEINHDTVEQSITKSNKDEIKPDITAT